MSSNTDSEDPVKKAIGTCEMIQHMIDLAAKQLDGLRTMCAASEITQKEIRDTESKLIKFFSQQLVAKARLATDEVHEELAEYPKTEQWLIVVGINREAIAGILEREITLNLLLDMTEEEVRTLLERYGSTEDEIRNLDTALRNLKICTDKELQGEQTNQDWHFTVIDMNKSTSNSPCGGNSPKYQQRPIAPTLPADPLVNSPPPADIPTPPQSTPSSPVPLTHMHRYTPPTTPPLPRPHSVGKSRGGPTLKVFDQPTITKSKSHESQLAFRVIDIDPVRTKKKPINLKTSGSHEAISRRRLSTEGSDTDTLAVPRSPKTPFNIGNINSKLLYSNHRFNNTFKITTCDACHKQMFLGVKCKDCKKKFHRDCASKAPPNCGYSDCDSIADSPLQGRRPTNPNILSGSGEELGLKNVVSLPVLPGHNVDSSSNTSSCNSSSPSSPALNVTSSGTVTSPSPGPSPQLQMFSFPEVRPDVVSTLPADFALSDKGGAQDSVDVVNTNTSNDSDKTLIDSNTSDKNMLDSVDSVDSQDDPLGHSWNRQNSLSVAMREWDIPYEELQIKEAIGKGRIGTVFRGHWHGDVAIKLLNMDSDNDNQTQLAAFKLEVALLRKTRHENLVLFMGACMKPPRLAIVTSFCRGETLYHIIHVKRETFKINRAMIVASQIAQGMGYLHARGIVHKDLRTKNIFMDSGKVVIADFGLFNVTKICKGNKKDDWLSIPPGWLCYLSPEIIRLLQSKQPANAELPFTEASDLYAFGTVWYELLCTEWPFKGQPAETIIWQVGKGMKQSLSTVNAPREVKDILMSCWAFKPDDRPFFSQVAKALDRIPKNRLMRSPSHPIHLSRSTEGIFNA